MATKPRKGSSSARPASRGAKRPAARVVRSHASIDEDESFDFGRPQRPSLIRAAVAGRGPEFGGIALVCLGVLLAVATYTGGGGPLGGLLQDISSWLIGLGRYVLPIAVIAGGIVSMKRVEVQHKVRLAFGWVVILLGLLGSIHVVMSDGSIGSDLDTFRRGGGAFGWLLGALLERTINNALAVMVLLALVLVGVLITTNSTLPQLVRRIKAWVDGGVTRQHSSDHEHDQYRHSGAEFYDIALDELQPKRMRERKQRVEETDVAEDELADEIEEEAPKRTRKVRKPLLSKIPVANDGPTAVAIVKAQPQQMPLGPGARASNWVLPTLDMLTVTRHEKADERLTEERGDKLVDALKEHNVETEMVGYTRGPTVTRYELSLGGGVKVAKVTSLSRDIAYTMAATDVRILAPIPGKSAIGIEVPNAVRELVSLGDLMVSQESRAAMHPLDVAVGKDIAGRSVFLNISTTPHMLIAGTTGAGKSSAINCIITSVLMRTTPDQVRLILIDPKQVEMGQYARLPHLLTPPVTNPKKAANALGWAVKEMERRYDLLVEAGFRDISGFNSAYDRGDLEGEDADEKSFERMPYILVVVDELNDLMMIAARDVEDCITRIAQKARAVGIHLIVATQRPSVNVITGVIKANIPARMAFAVSSLTDSRVILDQPGAEKLIGKGDMLLLPGNTSVAQRIQSAWVDESEVRKVVAHWRRQAPEVVYVSGVDGDPGGGNAGDSLFGGTTGDSGDDELLRQAMDLVVRTRQGSTSMLQRKLKVGFARAGRIMDLLESRGVVGPSEGSKPREVLMTVEELEQLQHAS